MVTNDFLDALKAYTEDVVKDMILPCRIQREGEDQMYRAPEVYKMRLPDSSAAKKKAPYIIHQVTTQTDRQLSGREQESKLLIRSVFCVYNDDEQEGALSLIELIDRFRIALLKNPVVAGKYKIDNTSKLEVFIYPEDTAPYYAGEIATVWNMPKITREETYKWVREPQPKTKLSQQQQMWERTTAVKK